MSRGMVTLAIIVLAVVHSIASHDYSAQSAWGGDCNKETSKKQSPVDVISPEKITVVDGELLELPVAAGSLTANNANNDNEIKFTFAETVKYTIPGINVEGTVSQFHIHWGASDGEGSEHWLNGKQFSAETHLVTSYGTDGKYAVVNRFFKVGTANEQVAQMLTSAEASDDARTIAEFNLTALYPSDIGEIITYEGSLTTPDCNEVVYWVIVPEALTVSTAQLESLRTVSLGDGSSSAKTYNWRNKQDLNERKFTCYKSSSATLLASRLLVVLAIIISIMH